MSFPTIISQPTHKVVAAYRPIVYEIETTDGGFSCYVTKQISADIYIGGQLFTTVYTDVPYYVSGGTRRWKIDISTVMQEAMTNKLQTIGTGAGIVTEMCKEVYVIFYEWSTWLNPYNSDTLIFKSEGTIPADDALIPEEFIGTPPQSDLLTVLDATLQHYEIQDLDDFLFDGIGTSTKKFLTHKPLKTYVCTESSEFIYILFDKEQTFWTRINNYNSAGELIGSLGFSSINFLPDPEEGIALVALPCGVTNLTPDFLFPDTAYYTIDVQMLGQFSEVRKYIIKNNCCSDGLRVHFKNLFGVFDSTNLDLVDKEEFLPIKTSFTKNLPLNFAIKDRGRNTMAASGSIELAAIQQLKDRENALWLSEIATSPDVFIQREVNGNQDYYPYEVKADKIMIRDDEETEFEVKFVFTESNSRIVQHN